MPLESATVTTFPTTGIPSLGKGTVAPPTTASAEEKHVSMTVTEKAAHQPSEKAQAGPAAATTAESLAMLSSPVDPSISKEPADEEPLPEGISFCKFPNLSRRNIFPLFEVASITHSY